MLIFAQLLEMMDRTLRVAYFAQPVGTLLYQVSSIFLMKEKQT